MSTATVVVRARTKDQAIDISMFFPCRSSHGNLRESSAAPFGTFAQISGKAVSSALRMWSLIRSAKARTVMVGLAKPPVVKTLLLAT